MPGLGSIISAAVQGAVSALLSPLVRWWQDRQQQQIGKLQQQNADLATSNQEARDAQSIDSSVAAAGDNAVDERLSKFSRPGS